MPLTTTWAPAWSTWTTTTASTDYIWSQWMTGSIGGATTTTVTATASPCPECGAGRAGPYSHHPSCSTTIALERAEEESLRRRREARREGERQRREVEARATELLRLVLAPDERALFDETGTVRVTGSDGRTYEVGPGTVGNVVVLDDRDLPVERWCAHPELALPGGGWLPTRDAHVGQVLALRHDAPGFIARANLQWRRLDAEREADRRRRAFPIAA